MRFIFCRESLPQDKVVRVTLDIQHVDLLSTNPSNFTISQNERERIIYVRGLSAGHSIVSANVTPKNVTE